MTEVASVILPSISRLSGQHFYGEPVGTYVIEMPAIVVLFDLPTYSEAVEKYLASFGKPIVAFLSHGSCGIADGTRWQQKLGVKVYLHEADQSHSWLRMKPDVLFGDPPRVSDDLEIIHTPGHSPGSVCLYDKTTKTLFTGDTLYGTREGSIRDFMVEKDGTAAELQERFNSAKMLVEFDFENILPFHYEMVLGDAKSALSYFLDSVPH